MLPRGTICSQSFCQVVVKVGHLTVEAFVLSGSGMASIAEKAKSSTNRLAFEAIMNCSAQ